MQKYIHMLLSTVVAGAALLGGAAVAQDKTISLRVADSFPAGHFIPATATIPWMDEVTKKTNGRVKFEYFPAQQLGKAPDLLNLTQTGVADIGYVGMSYVSDKMPLSSVAQLPGAFTTACQGTGPAAPVVASARSPCGSAVPSTSAPISTPSAAPRRWRNQAAAIFMPTG